MVSNSFLIHVYSFHHGGMSVLVDKPVTATAQEAYELGELAKAKGVVLYPFQNRRWDSDFLTLRKLLDLPSSDPKSLGTLVEFESRYVLRTRP